MERIMTYEDWAKEYTKREMRRKEKAKARLIYLAFKATLMLLVCFGVSLLPYLMGNGNWVCCELVIALPICILIALGDYHIYE